MTIAVEVPVLTNGFKQHRLPMCSQAKIVKLIVIMLVMMMMMATPLLRMFYKYADIGRKGREGGREE